jgi:predicted nucleic acid-binding protein
VAICVVDASFMLAWCFKENAPAEMDTLERIFRNGAVVPVIWPLEIVNALLGAERSNRLKGSIAYHVAEITQLLVEIDRRTPEMAWHRIAELARKHGLTSYDAAYLELATRRDAVLVTLDKALASAGKAEGLLVIPSQV